jgi:hypothetical protein
VDIRFVVDEQYLPGRKFGSRGCEEGHVDVPIPVTD